MIKIVLAGLDNAGKSSLLLSVNRKFSHLPTTVPTKGSVRTKFDYFGRKIIGFDLGGQKVYRDDYVTRPELFFAETDLLFYIVDIQDKPRYKETEDYFVKILEALQKLHERPKIVIVFHKCDPDMQDNAQLLANLQNEKEIFASSAKDHDLAIDYSKTSIFDRQSIDAMFSVGFRLISSISGIVEKLLTTYYETTSARALALLDSDNLILGQYAADEKDSEILLQSALLFQALFNYHQKAGFEKRESFELPYGSGTFIMEKVKDIQDKSYYLWVLTKDAENAKKHVPFFKEDLFPIVGYFFTSDRQQ